MSAPLTKRRIIGGISQNSTQLTNGRWARQMGIPAGWKKLRLGARLHTTDSGADLAGTPTFGMGLCHGLTNILGDAAADHFFGLYTASLGGNGGQHGPTYYYSNVTSIGVVVAGVLTTGLDMNGVHKWTVGNQAGVADDVAMIFLDISRVNPTNTSQLYTIVPFYSFAAAPALIDLSTFIAAMQIDPPNPIVNYEQGNTRTLTVDEGTNGVFDAMNFYWSPSAASMELCSVALCQLA